MLAALPMWIDFMRAAIAGKDVDRTVESRFSMNRPQATISGISMRGGIGSFSKRAMREAAPPGQDGTDPNCKETEHGKPLYVTRNMAFWPHL